jgi:N-acetylmuramoyl-L-alanine amidase
MNKPKHIIVHHSITPRDLNNDVTENSFNNTHKSKGFPASYFNGNTWYIGYHYVIYGDGEVRQYRTAGTVGAHCKEENMNYKSIGICLVGDFDKEMPSMAQIDSLKRLVDKLRADLNIPYENIAPHRKYATYKSCYGTNLPDDPNEMLNKTDNNITEADLAHRRFRSEGVIKQDKDLSSSPNWGELLIVLDRLNPDKHG